MIEDKILIQELSSMYCFAVDAGDEELYIACWDTQGISEAPFGKAKGHQELRERFRRTQQSISKGKRHVVTNFVVDVQGEKAFMKSYLVVYEREIQAKVVATSYYEDELVKVDGQWKFIIRRLTVDPSFSNSNKN